MPEEMPRLKTYVRWTAEKMATMQTRIEKHSRAMAERDAAAIDKRRAPAPAFKVDDQVAVRAHKPGKMAPLWYGPLRVVEVQERGNYRLAPVPEGTHDVFHSQRLRRWGTAGEGGDVEPTATESGTTGGALYRVEALVGKREREGATEYRVKWYGWPMASCTWEAERSLHQQGFDDEIAAFEALAAGDEPARAQATRKPRAVKRGGVPQPRGRPPKGKMWDRERAIWVAKPPHDASGEAANGTVEVGKAAAHGAQAAKPKAGDGARQAAAGSRRGRRQSPRLGTQSGPAAA